MCVRVCARVRACVRVCACVCACVLVALFIVAVIVVLILFMTCLCVCLCRRLFTGSEITVSDEAKSEAMLSGESPVVLIKHTIFHGTEASCDGWCTLKLLLSPYCSCY